MLLKNLKRKPATRRICQQMMQKTAMRRRSLLGYQNLAVSNQATARMAS